MNRLFLIFIAGFLALCTISHSAEPTAAELKTGIQLAPKIFRQAAEKVKPSIVSIESFGGAGGINTKGATTGLIVGSDGYILTSTFNFVGKPPVITVILPDKSRKIAKLLGRDDSRKICLLKVEDVADLSTPEFTPKGEVQIGQWAISLGVGYGGDEPAMSTGIVSALRRVGGVAIQTDANISPANYGGPLIDIQGRVIGLCVPLQPGSKDAKSGTQWYDSGIGFAIPLVDCEKRFAKMKAGETIKSAFLGVQLEPKDGVGKGAHIADVQADSPAAKAGVEKGDIIQKVGDVNIVSVVELKAELAAYLPGEVVKFTILRKEDSEVLEIELGEGAAAKPPAPKPNVKIDPREEPGES